MSTSYFQRTKYAQIQTFKVKEFMKLMCAFRKYLSVHKTIHHYIPLNREVVLHLKCICVVVEKTAIYLNMAFSILSAMLGINKSFRLRKM